MRYIETFREGMHVSDVYLCKNKQIAFSYHLPFPFREGFFISL